jgi:hypothetical protein
MDQTLNQVIVSDLSGTIKFNFYYLQEVTKLFELIDSLDQIIDSLYILLYNDIKIYDGFEQNLKENLSNIITNNEFIVFTLIQINEEKKNINAKKYFKSLIYDNIDQHLPPEPEYNSLNNYHVIISLISYIKDNNNDSSLFVLLYKYINKSRYRYKFLIKEILKIHPRIYNILDSNLKYDLELLEFVIEKEPKFIGYAPQDILKRIYEQDKTLSVKLLDLKNLINKPTDDIKQYYVFY